MQSRALIVFVKNPEKGKVKTRLAATVGDDRALEIYQSLLRHTREVTLGVEATRYLYYAEYIATNDDWPSAAFEKRLQHPGDLGARMSVAFAEVLRDHSQAVIVGSDIATLTREILEEAFRQLENRDYVIGPAEDGGYYLLGMKAHHPSLFSGIAWSTERVRQQTVAAMQQLGSQPGYLPTLSDIDYAEDWEKHGWSLRSD